MYILFLIKSGVPTSVSFPQITEQYLHFLVVFSIKKVLDHFLQRGEPASVTTQEDPMGCAGINFTKQIKRYCVRL
ncbi:hypothetical protein RCJ22_28570, partial [Vibrio sp. FNV 38]|nr:hypothetical protein [Vibrio sp. FNV 38]